MTLQPVHLDDLNWSAMVDAVRGRIAAASQEEWTLHAPVDPGVTLLELFACLLEQRLYWMDQVPDALMHGLLALLGAERRPAQAARTLLALPPTLPGLDVGAVFRIRDGGSVIRVTTTDDAASLALERIEVAGAFGSSEARHAPAPSWAFQPLTLLPADRGDAEVKITLWLRQPPTVAQHGRPLALLLDLDAPAKIPAGWSNEAVADVTPPAILRWFHSVAGGEQRQAFADGAVDDGSQGLRRSGVVRLAIPASWAATRDPVNGLTPYCLWLRTEAATFSAPPRLNRIVPNVVAASHAVAVTVSGDDLRRQVDKWLPLPGLTLPLADKSPPIEDSLKLRLRGRDGVWRDWAPTWEFSRHGPADAVVMVDRELNCLHFGDGLTGRLPVVDKAPGDIAELSYLAGGGTVGELGSGLVWACTDPEAEAVNPVPVRGGRETETAAEARDRVAAELVAVHRAVTASDHERLAIDTPGVAVKRARAIAGHHPGFPCISVPGAISVFIVPDVPRGEGWLDGNRAMKAPQPDPGMLAEVRGHLDDRRLLATELFVLGPSYREVEVVATIAAGPLDKAAMAAHLRSGLTLYVDALVGGDEGLGWPFGQPVRPSELAHQLQKLSGANAVIEWVGARLADAGSAQSFEDCVDIAIAAHELVVLKSLKLTWKQLANQRGGLR